MTDLFRITLFANEACTQCVHDEVIEAADMILAMKYAEDRLAVTPGAKASCAERSPSIPDGRGETAQARRNAR